MILGRLSSEQIVRAYASGAVWLVVAALLFSWTWRAGVKRFSAVGA
jgi:ABC-type uncharacterized transport system permease subunit